MTRPHDPATSPGREADVARAPGAAPPRGRWKRWLGFGLVLLLVAGGSLYWWRGGFGGAQQQAAPAPRKGVPVEVAEATVADVPVYLNGLGTVQAFNSVLLRSRVDGQIDRIAFQEGQMVRQGDVLVQIDPRPYRAALDQAIAKKAQDEASLVSIKADLERTRRLASQSFATPQQLDQQTASSAALEAQIKADQALIESAQTQLDYTTIRSPLNGRTGLRLIDQGNIVRSADTTGIVEVVQLQPISVLFTAPEGQLSALASAMQAGPVEVAAIGSDGRSVVATGTLALINNEVDAATGTVKLKATFANQDARLWPGLSMNTRLLAETLRQVVTVPEAAVQRSRTGLFAFVVGPDQLATKRDLKVGPIANGIAVIEDGLKPGERVVTAGQSRVVENGRVEPSPRPGDRPDHNHVAAVPGEPAPTRKN